MKLFNFIYSVAALSEVGIVERILFLFSERGRRYLNNFIEYKKQGKALGASLAINKILPCIKDFSSQSAHLPQHYFYQDLYVANMIFNHRPNKHLDIGSRVDGFVAHVASFREIEVLDIRPLNINFKNIVFKQGDLMNELGLSNYCDSISSLHVIEHIGLGRYNDAIDYYGYLKALENIYIILKNGGKFYFSVPIGRAQTVFNAHRIFEVGDLVKFFQKKYRIDSFSYINDLNEFVNDASYLDQDLERYQFEYGCGIFELTKLPAN